MKSYEKLYKYLEGKSLYQDLKIMDNESSRTLKWKIIKGFIISDS